MLPWMIVYETVCPALEKLCGTMQPYLPYTVPCGTSPRDGFNTVTLRTDPSAEGFRIDVSACEDGERQSVLLTAQDETNLYYAVSDFANVYLPDARRAETHAMPYYFKPVFTAPMKEYHRASKPQIAERGLWLWGFTIGDYRRFIEHMAALKLNVLTIWNDSLPVNITDVIGYAHRFGIRVYLGFAWGWDTARPTCIDDTVLDGISAGIIKEYEDRYAALSCDGIYFQTFTEQASDTIGGILVADAAVRLINRTAGALWEKHPDLRLQFGLHATSVKDHLDVIARTDARITIVWEDCGAFPYAYLPEKTEDFAQTAEFTEKLLGLNGGGFGAVLKGVICLDWGTFRHLKGPYMLGCAGDGYLEKRLDGKREIYRYLQAYWMKNGHYAAELIRLLPKDACVTCLVEDGVFERFVNFPTALYAALLWDSDRPYEDVLCETAMRQDVEFA